MNDKTDLSRRTTLGLIGAFGASLTAGCGGGSSDSDDSSSPSIINSANAGTISASKLGGGCSHGLVLPHSASTVVDTVTAAAEAALTNDLETILSTYSSWDQNLVVLAPNADGTLNLRTALSLDELRQLHTASLADHISPGGENRLNEHLGRWYDLIDTRYNVKLLSSGTTLNRRGMFLFLTWPDGVAGQIVWNEPSWVQPFNIEDPKTLTYQLIAYEDAWRSGDVTARLATIEAQTCSVARVTDLTGTRRSRFVARTQDELRAAWDPATAGTVLELERLHHVVSTYYVFAAHRLVLKVAGKKVLRETATVLPLGPNRKFVGELSYSFETEL